MALGKGVGSHLHVFAGVTPGAREGSIRFRTSLTSTIASPRGATDVGVFRAIVPIRAKSRDVFADSR